MPCSMGQFDWSKPWCVKRKGLTFKLSMDALMTGVSCYNSCTSHDFGNFLPEPHSAHL